MGSQEFYVLQETYTDFASMLEHKENEVELYECMKCTAVMRIPKNEVKIYFKGNKTADFYSYSLWSIINQKLQDTLSEQSITGFKLQDINFQGWFNKKGNSIEVPQAKELKEIVITGRAGLLRHKDGRILDHCSECKATSYKIKKTVDGLSVGLDEWDGSDMFCFTNWAGNIIVTQKVKDIIEKGNFKNIQFTHINDFKFQ